MDQAQEPTVRERFESLLDDLPIHDFQEAPRGQTAGIEAEIDATFERLREYLEAVQEFWLVSGYHRALVSAQSQARKEGALQGGWYTEELKRFDDEGRYGRAVSRVKELQTDSVVEDLEKAKRLIDLAAHAQAVK